MANYDRGDPVPHSHEYFLGLVKTLPIISVEDPRVQRIINNPFERRDLYRESFGQFGNNFHFLFEGLSFQRAGQPLDPALHSVKVAQAEALGDSWRRFMGYHTTQDLLAKFDVVLEEGKPYETFKRYHRRLVASDLWFKIEALEQTIAHPLGLKALDAAYNDRRNSVLAVAAASMKAFGIRPEQFFT